MHRLGKRIWILLAAIACLVLASPVLAGPIGTPTPSATATATGTPGPPGTPTGTPTATATATGTATGTPTATGTATATPSSTPPPTCQDIWPDRCIFTIGKGQSPANNRKIDQTICGHIPNPGALGETASRIPICRGTNVKITVDQRAPAGGSPVVTSRTPGISCSGNVCTVTNMQGTQKYIARSSDGKDTDRMTLILPK